MKDERVRERQEQEEKDEIKKERDADNSERPEGRIGGERTITKRQKVINILHSYAQAT